MTFKSCFINEIESFQETSHKSPWQIDHFSLGESIGQHYTCSSQTMTLVCRINYSEIRSKCSVSSVPVSPKLDFENKLCQIVYQQTWVDMHNTSMNFTVTWMKRSYQQYERTLVVAQRRRYLKYEMVFIKYFLSEALNASFTSSVLLRGIISFHIVSGKNEPLTYFSVSEMYCQGAFWCSNLCVTTC